MMQVAGMVLSFALAPISVAKAASFQPRVQIHNVVQVEGERLRLSDLLPRDAPEGLGEICRRVELGDAPQAASQRVISREQIEQQLRDFPSTLKRLEIPDRVIVTRKRRRLSPAEIRAAIESFMASEESHALQVANLSGLKLQAPAFVTTQDPGLEVKGVEADRVERKTRFLLWTSKEPQVLPFYVTVEGLPETADWASSPRVPSGKSRNCADSDAALRSNVALPNAPSGLLEGHSARLPVQKGQCAQPATSPPTVLVVQGKPAKFVIEMKTLRLAARVTPLQSGVQGQIIRVRNEDTQRVLEAEVVGVDLLQAPLGGE